MAQAALQEGRGKRVARLGREERARAVARVSEREVGDDEYCHFLFFWNLGDF